MKVGRSERIKQYEDKLVCIDAWSTLHELTKLNEHQFDRFKAKYLSDDEPKNFMRADVKRFKNGASVKRAPFSLLAAIEVDVTRLNEPDDMLAIGEELTTLEQNLSRFAAVRVRRTDLTAKFEAKEHARAEKLSNQDAAAAVSKARRRLREVVQAEIAKEIGPNKKAKFFNHWGLEWDEIFSSNVNPNTRLQMFGYEPVDPALVDSQFEGPQSGTCATSVEETELARTLAELEDELASEVELCDQAAMKTTRVIEGIVPLIVEYKHLSNDDAVRKMLDDIVDLCECENGVDSDKAFEMRHRVRSIRRAMLTRGPDHGFSVDEKGFLKLRGPH